MRKHLLTCLVALIASASILTPQSARVTALRAGKVFDPVAGKMLLNQIILIEGERITAEGPAGEISIPNGAAVIDLRRATVLPGLIDGHVHLTDATGGLQHQTLVALHSAMESLKAGYTTQVVQGSHGGGFADVELKRAIDEGLVQGPRLLPAGPILAITRRAIASIPSISSRSKSRSSETARRACGPVFASWPTTAPITSKFTRPVPSISNGMARWSTRLFRASKS